MQEINDFGHWGYPGHFSPDDWFGFIYRIVDLDTNREYIGKKQFWSVTRKTVKGKTRKKVVRKQSDWRSYTSSSKHVNTAIDERGKDRFVFLIETLYKSKAALHYGEVETQINEDVLRAKLPSGERKYYNAMVGHMKFITPDELLEETQMKIRKTTTTIVPNDQNIYFGEMSPAQKQEWVERYRMGGTPPVAPVVAPVASQEKTCPHCGLMGKGGSMTRYHFDNCKKKGG